MSNDQRQAGADGRTVARAGRWDADAFAAQFMAGYRALWCVAMGVVGNRAAAEDVVQEAAVQALHRLEQFDPDRPGSSFTAWMGQIVRHVAQNHRRREHLRTMQPLHDHLPRQTPAPDAPTEFRLGTRGRVPPDQAHFDDRLARALAGLSEPARACLLLRTIEGLDYHAIASLLDIPPGTAMSHVHRARAQLRAELSETRQGEEPR